MLKVPDLSSKDILEIKNKFKLGVTYAKLKREYNISYYDIKKICLLFDTCLFEDDVSKTRDEIQVRNQIKKRESYKINYRKHRAYFLAYSKNQYAKKKSLILKHKEINMAETHVLPATP